MLAVKLGLTGTNRSCNKASCGACSVLMDGRPFYSCHTLAMEAIGKKVLTIEGVGTDEQTQPAGKSGPRFAAQLQRDRKERFFQPIGLAGVGCNLRKTLAEDHPLAVGV